MKKPFLLIALFAVSCGNPPGRKRAAAISPDIPRPARPSMAGRGAAERRDIERFYASALKTWEDERADRRELVRRAGSAPRGEGPVRLKLVFERSMLRRGSPLRYRLELENAGEETLHIFESDSFFKDGRAMNERVRLYARGPGDDAEKLLLYEPGPPRRAGTIEFPSWAGARGHAEAGNRGRMLSLRLLPGEALVTRPAGAFRELPTSFRFETPGTYRVRAVFEGGEWTAESEPVAVEAM